MKNDWPILATLLATIVFGSLGIYVGGYFVMGTAAPPLIPGAQMLRVYPTEWQATIFQPAATVESWCRGDLVSTVPAVSDMPDLERP